MKSNTNNCPMCKEPIEILNGDQMHPGDLNHGVTVQCINIECHMADWGHGKNENAAFEVFKQKCGL